MGRSEKRVKLPQLLATKVEVTIESYKVKKERELEEGEDLEENLEEDLEEELEGEPNNADEASDPNSV
ncbi:hypothetical protein PVK06_005417 [Gossypium arboreum]|uniref:Uncharacterized protein n=1 Tax=Gossypium arboreum TaxID=29729 RepID=A0ABR0QVW1_GOSAR|nr:hypothetical protein PVK06_005417 [Gossypium arboreum]